MGRSVLVVGGLDHLVRYYKEIAYVFGYQFYHHNGKCKSGKKKLYRLVGQADVVFCPIIVIRIILYNTWCLLKIFLSSFWQNLFFYITYSKLVI